MADDIQVHQGDPAPIRFDRPAARDRLRAAYPFLNQKAVNRLVTLERRIAMLTERERTYEGGNPSYLRAELGALSWARDLTLRLLTQRHGPGIEGYSWTEHGPGEWWHDQTGEKEEGVGYPPRAWVSFPPNDNGRPLQEGCLHYFGLYNGSMPREDPDQADYMHICGREGLDELITSLSELRTKLYGAPRHEHEDGEGS